LFPDPELQQAELDVAQWSRSGERFVSVLDADYPTQLRDIHQVPAFLFARGTLTPDDRAVSVVGSRKAGDAGLRMAGNLARALVDRGITVLSGLAAGIDAAAHSAALAAGGRTVAIIGTGITRSYPAGNRALQEQISSDGLVLSQFWPDAPPTRQSFPMRNAVMSGYGFASVIVEAGEQSGARIQARMAVEHGRPVILTDVVVRNTDWGKRLQHQPGVSVASSITEATQQIEEIDRRQSTIHEVLAELTQTGS